MSNQIDFSLHCSTFTRLDVPSTLKFVAQKLYKDYNIAYDDLARDEKEMRELSTDTRNPRKRVIQNGKAKKIESLKMLQNKMKSMIDDFLRYSMAHTNSHVAKRELARFRELLNSGELIGEEIYGIRKKITMYQMDVDSGDRIDKLFPSFKKRLDLERSGRDEKGSDNA